jgi:phosphotriesterase-related protein
MATVQTAKGPVDTSSLGRVLMHEHVFVISTEIQLNYSCQFPYQEQRPS